MPFGFNQRNVEKEPYQHNGVKGEKRGGNKCAHEKTLQGLSVGNRTEIWDWKKKKPAHPKSGCFMRLMDLFSDIHQVSLKLKNVRISHFS